MPALSKKCRKIEPHQAWENVLLLYSINDEIFMEFSSQLMRLSESCTNFPI